jgi:hypothetical protein
MPLQVRTTNKKQSCDIFKTEFSIITTVAHMYQFGANGLPQVLYADQ